MAENELPEVSGSELRDQVAALQRLVFSLLLALIVVSGTLTVYLYRQASLTHKDIDSIRPQAEQIITAFNANRAAMQNFIKELNAYGQTHPDIEMILQKNGFASGVARK